MSNILFVCAMEKEGKQIAEKLGMSEISNKLFEIKKTAEIEEKSVNKEKDEQNSEIEKCKKSETDRLLITGIGKQFTAINLTEYLCKNDKPDLIVNIGYAGSTDIQIGKWVNISRSYNYEWEIPGEEKYVMLAGRKSKNGYS